MRRRLGRIGVAVAAVLAGCSIYAAHYLYVKYVRGPGAQAGAFPALPSKAN